MPRRRLLRLGISTLFCVAVSAQSGTEQMALLAVGPIERRGIDYFAPDLTPHWYGTYEWADDTIEVYYAEQPLDEAASWPRSPCELIRLRQDGEGAVYYLDDERWSVLMIPSDQRDNLPLCSFASRWVRQFQFFQNLERSVRLTTSPAFPAVLDN
ncbi:MAG: hypothetical protein ACLFP4_04230 [Spirochaetales bacterium]